MFREPGIKLKNVVEDKEEVMLDGGDGLEAAFSSQESGYPMYNIKLERGFYTIFELKRKYDSKVKRIILDSDFQRESVWKPAQKAELVESILMGLPLPIFYFNIDKLGRLILIDGRQRLTALFEYMSDKWALKGLKVLDELNGKKFRDLEPIVQAKIEDYQLQAHVIQPPTPDRIKFDIFDRVNRAGTQLNKQEIRNALYQGKATKLLNEIVRSKEFECSTGGAFQKNARMKDKYLVLRFLAFELYFSGEILEEGKKYSYKNDIDELLGLTMEHINAMTDEEVHELNRMTLKALDNTYQYLGENAFRMVRSNGSRSPINMNVFEVVMHLMVGVDSDAQVTKDFLNTKVTQMKEDKEFKEAIGNHRDSWMKVEKRYAIVNNIVEEIHAENGICEGV